MIAESLPEILNIPSHRSISLSQELYEPIVKVLKDYQIHTFEELRLALPEAILSNLGQALAILHAMDLIVVVQEDDVIDSSRESSHAMNEYIIDNSLTGTNINYLMSPVNGGAIKVSRLDQLMIYAYLHESHEKQKMVHFVWSILQKNNQRLIHEGKTLESDAENLDKMSQLVDDFLEKSMPIYQLLQLF